MHKIFEMAIFWERLMIETWHFAMHLSRYDPAYLRFYLLYHTSYLNINAKHNHVSIQMLNEEDKNLSVYLLEMTSFCQSENIILF